MIHALKTLPTIEITDAELHLYTHDLVKAEITYVCMCGVVLRTSDVVPRGSLVDEPTTFTTLLTQLGGRARDTWREHLEVAPRG